MAASKLSREQKKARLAKSRRAADKTRATIRQGEKLQSAQASRSIAAIRKNVEEAIAGGVTVVIVLRQDKSQPDNDLLCNLVSFRWPRSEVDQINSLVADAVVNYKAALAAK